RRLKPGEAVDFLQCGGDLIGRLAGDEEQVEDRIGYASVGVGVRARAQKLERTNLKIDLLAQFTAQPILGRFADVDEAAGHGQEAAPGFFAAADEQHSTVAVPDEGRRGDGRIEIVMKSTTGAVEGIGLPVGRTAICAAWTELELFAWHHGEIS